MLSDEKIFSNTIQSPYSLLKVDVRHLTALSRARFEALGALLQGNEQLKAELFEPPAGGHAISEAEKAEEAAKSELRDKEHAAKPARLKKLEQAGKELEKMENRAVRQRGGAPCLLPETLYSLIQTLIGLM